MELNEILNSDDLRELLNISKNKLTRLTKQGLPCVCLGERKVFLKDSILHWFKDKEKAEKGV